jgi:hypothetical protein
LTRRNGCRDVTRWVSRSPPVNITRNEPGRGQPTWSIPGTSPVGTNAVRTSCVSMNRWRATGSRISSSDGTASPAPWLSGPQISMMLASKVSSATWQASSPGINRARPWYHRTSRASAACPTTTPFGVPVEPDVKMT